MAGNKCEFDTMKISVIGAGNGGQAIAGFCAAMGASVCLYNHRWERISSIAGHIHLVGAIKMTGNLDLLTDNIEKAVSFADIIMIATTASAHRELARLMSPYLRDGQIIILNPGRTLGLLEYCSVLHEYNPTLRVYAAEAQTLVYACREQSPGCINIIGVKERVLLAGRSKEETNLVIEKLRPIYSCFIPATLAQTSLENIGAIFHPPVVLFNAATIERNTPFYFYRDMTPNIAAFIQKLDQERLMLGKAVGVDLMPVNDWIKYAYPATVGDDLCERMRNNPAYHDILAPGSIFTRQLTEDIPTGLLPMSELARMLGVQTPLMDAIVEISISLLGIDLRKNGRTLKNLGLSNMNKQDIIELLS